MNELQQMFCDTVRKMWSDIEEDWAEDGHLSIKNESAVSQLVEVANDILDELGIAAPPEFNGKHFLVYGSQLKILPVEKIEGAKQLAATFH